ncbi:MAG: rhodanese-like domain-containing protein, partial [Burkholderiaceae bacterium]|nr:rhodanese-like domain-containing protein [Burkholderiaceae bacterium]
MDFIVANWVLILAALVSGLMLAWPTLTGTGAATGLSANQAVLLINREKAVVVDVCEAAEYAQGHIAA